MIFPGSFFCARHREAEEICTTGRRYRFGTRFHRFIFNRPGGRASGSRIKASICYRRFRSECGIEIVIGDIFYWANGLMRKLPIFPLRGGS